MWLDLTNGDLQRVQLIDTQSIWPAPDGSDAELIITTRANLIQEVVLSSSRVARLKYTVKACQATMTLGGQPPTPWSDAESISGVSFELVLTEKGPMVMPPKGDKLPNRIASWLQIVSEDIRSAWPVPPDNISVGTTWDALPALPGGLPPGTSSASIQVVYEVRELLQRLADIRVRFEVTLLLDGRDKTPNTGRGFGIVDVKLDPRTGLASATRSGQMEIIRATSRNQVVKNTMQIRRI